MPDLERVRQNAPAVISQQFYNDAGAAADPGAVTVGITRADGTVLVAAGAATSGTTTAPRTFNLTASQTALLDRLTVTWTSATLGIRVSYVEVAGGFLFETATALADDEISGTADEIVDARTMAEVDFEEVCGRAFVPRYERETFDGTGSADLTLRPRLRTVRSASIDGTALTSAELADLEYTTLGRLRHTSRWTAGAEVVIGYEHGHDFLPLGVSRAVLRLAKHYLTDWSADDRALRLDTDAGSYVMAVPGRGGSDFGIPEVDAVARRYAHVHLVG